jgi:hypothetical protein
MNMPQSIWTWGEGEAAGKATSREQTKGALIRLFSTTNNPDARLPGPSLTCDCDSYHILSVLSTMAFQAMPSSRRRPSLLSAQSRFVLFEGAPTRADIEAYLDDSDAGSDSEILVWDVEQSTATFVASPPREEARPARASSSPRPATTSSHPTHSATNSKSSLTTPFSHPRSPPSGSHATASQPSSHPPNLPSNPYNTTQKPSPFLTQSLESHSTVEGTIPEEEGKLKRGRRGKADPTPSPASIAAREAAAAAAAAGAIKLKGAGDKLLQSLSLVLEEDTTGQDEEGEGGEGERQPLTLGPALSTTFFPTFAAPFLPSSRTYTSASCQEQPPSAHDTTTLLSIQDDLSADLSNLPLSYPSLDLSLVQPVGLDRVGGDATVEEEISWDVSKLEEGQEGSGVEEAKTTREDHEASEITWAEMARADETRGNDTTIYDSKEEVQLSMSKKRGKRKAGGTLS